MESERGELLYPERATAPKHLETPFGLEKDYVEATTQLSELHGKYIKNGKEWPGPK